MTDISNSTVNSSLTSVVVKRMFKSKSTIPLLAVAVLALSGSLSGCATTQSLTPQQCQANNWQQLGYVDGSNGRSGAYFGHYTNSCASVVGAAPNRMLWEQGRQQGLKNYCTELTAYKVGREGYDWQPVCPLTGIDKLEEAYSQGRYYYIRQRDLDSLRSPYPFGYGGHGRFGYGYGPFGYGW